MICKYFLSSACWLLLQNPRAGKNAQHTKSSNQAHKMKWGFKIDQWTATPQEKPNSDGCWSHGNIILSFTCLNGSLMHVKIQPVGKSLMLKRLTGRFVLTKPFFSLTTVSFKNFSATLSKVTKLVFYVLNLVSWISCFLSNVPLLHHRSSTRTKTLSMCSTFGSGVNSTFHSLDLYYI